MSMKLGTIRKSISIVEEKAKTRSQTLNLTELNKDRIDALIISFRDTVSSDAWQAEISERAQRRAEFFNKFSSDDRLATLDYEELRTALKELWALMGWKNRDYFLQEMIKLSESSFPKNLKSLRELIFSTQDIKTRLEDFIANTSGMKIAFASEILMLARPKDYPLYNAKTEAVLINVGLFSKTIRSIYRRRHIPIGYSAFLETYSAILAYVNSKIPEIDDFAKLDAMFWMIKVEASDDDETIEVEEESDEASIRVIRMGTGHEFSRVFKLFKEKGIAAFGFDDVVDYDPAKFDGYDFSELKKCMQAKGASKGRINKIAQYILQFSRSRVGKDWFVACHKRHMYGFGVVSNAYTRDLSNVGWEHSLGVDWHWFDEPIFMKSEFSRDLCDQLSKTASVSVVRTPACIIELKKFLGRFGSMEISDDFGEEPELGNLTLEAISLKSHLPCSRLEELIQSFSEEKGKRQIIFDGPPGTGKTFVAQLLANYLANEEGKPKGQHTVITCHSALTFEHLFQGLCPDGNGKIIPRKGILADFFDKALENEEANFVLVLDEINRCNISQVFGPFLYLLENRDREVDLPFDGEKLIMPSNVFIIATMNSDDRSTGLVDFAFRRRFAHFRFAPDSDILRGYLQSKFHQESSNNNSEVKIDQYVRVFEILNKRLEKIDPQFQVGHSFFMIERIPTQVTLRRIWETEIIPYLAERFYHDRKIVEDEFDIDSLISESEKDIGPRIQKIAV